MPSLICVNPKDFTGQTYLVLHQVKLSTTNVIFEIREVNEGYALKKWESTLNFAFMPMDTMYILSLEASCNNNYFLENMIWLYELILCNRGPDPNFFL